MIIDDAFIVKASLPETDCNFYSKGSRYELVKMMVDYYENAGNTFRHKTYEFLRRDSATPDIIETVMTSIGIMQKRITRINLAVDRPDIHIQPLLGELKMMNLDHVEHAIRGWARWNTGENSGHPYSAGLRVDGPFWYLTLMKGIAKQVMNVICL